MSREELAAREEMWEGLVTTAQAVWETPRSILDSIFARVLGTAPNSVVRISAGTSNETYFCSSGKTRLVVRVGRHGRPHFEQERWAIAAARAAGVPAPDVLLVTHERVDREITSFAVEQFVPGVPLGTLARSRGRVDAHVATALSHAGEVLAAIHSVRTRGFGVLNGDGTAPLVDWPSYLDERMGPVAARQPEEVKRALAVLEGHRGLVATEPRLLHFDFEPAHLLVDETTGRIAGVVDWEVVKSGDVSYDLAQWDVIHDAYAPVAPLFESYSATGKLPGDFDKRRLYSEIHYRAREIIQGAVPSAFVGDSRSRLAAAVAQFAG